ncbi:hypothetical protein JXL21_00855 [Candidatus Bathyarchaeota archaeon]|nr:hypothetical protein [Candidatus Bathyarchaeota archaeon]
MNRTRTLIIAIPVMLVIGIGIITTLSLPLQTLEPEKISVYRVSATQSDFTFQEVTVKYYTENELTVRFYLSGGDGQKDLRFEFICLDANGDKVYASSSQGTLSMQAVGYQPNNSTALDTGDLVKGVLKWPDVPSGAQQIRAVIQLEDIVPVTEQFFIELRNLS